MQPHWRTDKTCRVTRSPGGQFTTFRTRGGSIVRSGLVSGASESLAAARLSTGRLFLPFQAGASGRAFMAEATNWSLKSHCVLSSTGSDGSVRLKTLLFRWAVRALDLWSLLPGSAKRLAASQVSLPAGPPDAAAALRPCLRDGHGAPACSPGARDSHPATPEKQPAPFFISGPLQLGCENVIGSPL